MKLPAASCRVALRKANAFVMTGSAKPVPCYRELTDRNERKLPLLDLDQKNLKTRLINYRA